MAATASFINHEMQYLRRGRGDRPYYLDSGRKLVGGSFVRGMCQENGGQRPDWLFACRLAWRGESVTANGSETTTVASVGKYGVCKGKPVAPANAGRTPCLQPDLVGPAWLRSALGKIDMPPRLLLFLMGAGLPATPARVLGIARFESRNLGHNFVGTEHVLCALARVPDSRLRQLFAQRRVTVETVRNGVVDQGTLGPHQHSRAFRPLTPRLRRVLMVAEGLAPQAKHLSVPQCLFVAIITEGWGVAARVLQSLGYDLAQLRETFPETAIEPRVTLAAFEPGDFIWLIHPAHGVKHAAGFVRDHKNGAYVFGGHTGSHYTGH
jgi:hypothetical protein